MKTAVKSGQYRNRFLSMDTRAPQRKCASASEFIYLAKSLETTVASDTPCLEEHNKKQNNYPIVPPNYQIGIDQQYADDIRKISNSISAVEKMKDELPVKLAQRGLEINE